ncbi:DUF6639 family protein [Tropicimonas marinistellae]|uniref:DUF6639 family protein n=1 Tax=Tropicimonas marinistellae TaxID=1739787 RepID=UPI0008351838|nr:DUF6639 family protein [Tropicimonas marinistellae]
MAPHRRRVAIGAFATLLCALGGVAAGAGASACDTPLVTVETADGDLHRRLCEIVASALPRLEECQLKLVSAVSIGFADSLHLGSPDQICFGNYHQRTDRIELLKPPAFERFHNRSEVWAAIPVTEHFDSIVVHELTHALVDQTAPATQSCTADQEYIAYAMQVASLSDSSRTTLINRVGVSTPTSDDEINSVILGLSPAAFAVNSWLHFSQPENGCDVVRKIIRGETTFLLLPE